MSFSLVGSEMCIRERLNSCSQINEELPVAGELICTAAGVERDECVKAAKINNEDGNNESEN